MLKRGWTEPSRNLRRNIRPMFGVNQTSVHLYCGVDVVIVDGGCQWYVQCSIAGWWRRRYQSGYLGSPAWRWKPTQTYVFTADCRVALSAAKVPSQFLRCKHASYLITSIKGVSFRRFMWRSFSIINPKVIHELSRHFCYALRWSMSWSWDVTKIALKLPRGDT